MRDIGRVVKKSVFLVVLLGFVFKAGAEYDYIPVRAADTYEKAYINVKDFGAKGDGKTDDTAAIQAALKAGYNRRRIPNHPQYRYFVSFSEIYFPSGHYIITDTLELNGVNVKGESYAAIEQINPEKEIFYFPDAWRQKIESMTFLGGKTHINMGNKNVDTGHVTVRDCHFYHSRDVSIIMRKGSNSTLFSVENCVFRYCMQSVISYCDMTLIKDCWIVTAREMKDMASIENRGVVMQIDNLLAVPIVNKKDEGYTVEWTDPTFGRKWVTSNQRWIDNYGSLHVRTTRFGGEGSGFSAIYNFAKYNHEYPLTPTSITIQDSSVYNSYNTAVVLKEIPNVISLTNNRGFVTCWVIRVDPELDLNTYFDYEKSSQAPHKIISIDISKNFGGFGIGLPEELWPYQVNEIFADKVPEKGIWERGQFVRNSHPERFYDKTVGRWTSITTQTIEEPYGWLCTESGKPGKWQPIYYLTTPEKNQSE